MNRGQDEQTHLVRVDSAVRAVRTPASLGRLVDDDRLDEQIIGFELVDDSIRLCIDDKALKVFRRLDGPSSCASIISRQFARG